MTEKEPYDFAAYQSLSRMALLFESQAKIIDQLLTKQLPESIEHASPLIGAIRDNCKAILVLEKAGLLNELFLLQHLFIQRVINFCYFLFADKEDVEKYLANPMITSGGTLRDESSTTFLDLARTYVPPACSSAFRLTLLEQADVISSKAGVPKDLFLVAIASVFPKASEILSGSLFGAVFHLGVFGNESAKQSNKRSHANENNGELLTMLYMGIKLLDAVCRSLSKCGPFDCHKESLANTEAANDVMKGLLGKADSVLSYSDGAWERLDKIELRTNEHLKKLLPGLFGAFKDAYDVGLIVPTLKPGNKPTLDLSFSALFLRRVLNDLRGVWNLLISGYTSQAASVAASLYESALASICLGLSQKNIDKFKASPNGEVPWSKKVMAEQVVRANTRITTENERQTLSEATYEHYRWLCQIKHSSLGSIIHDANAWPFPVVMAVPNLSDADLKFKASIAVISLIYTLDSVRGFAIALGYSEKFPDDRSFAQTYQRARDATGELFSKFLESNPRPDSPR